MATRIPAHGATPANIASRLDRLPISRLHYRLLIILGFGWLFDAMDVGIISFVVVPLSKDWHLTPGEVGLIGSSSLAGMAIGAAVGGFCADRWGRKVVFQVTLLVFAISTLLCASALDLRSMVIFRFLVGIGLGAELPVVASLMSEFVPARHRGRFIVLLESFWAYGWLVAAVTAFVLIPAYGWRVAFLVGAMPAFYIWVIRRALPESPRWLASKGRVEDAERIVTSFEKETERLTQNPLSPIHLDGGLPFVPAERIGLAELWTRAFRRRTIMLWVLWFGLVAGYYGVFLWLPSLLVKSGYSMVNSFFYVILITLAQIPGYFSAAYLIDWIGRKPVIVCYLLASAACAVLFGLSTTTVGILTWAALMSFFNLGAWGGVYTYTPELYPTRVRATGAGAAAAVGRVGGILSPIIIGVLLPTINQVGVLAFNAALLAMAAVAVAILGEETKGKSLEKVAA